jgi:hypothetical protein
VIGVRRSRDAADDDQVDHQDNLPSALRLHTCPSNGPKWEKAPRESRRLCYLTH